MQVFIRRSDMSQDTPPVIAWYDESAEVDPKAHGDCAILHLPAAAIASTGDGMPTLAKDWRTKYRDGATNSVATARINEVMPEESQLASIMELLQLILQHGADPAKWPAQAQARRTEIERGWSYVKAVRQKNEAMNKGAMPLDPSADTYWPSRIVPFKTLG